MPQKYLLPCSCGKDVPIETSQAGGNVLCDCGLSVQVPSLLKIKKLPLVGEAQVQSAATATKAMVSTPKAPSGDRVHLSIFWIGLVLTIAASAYCAYTILFTFPKPQDVLKKQRVYHFAGKVAVQDSTPIPMDEVEFFRITDEHIDRFSPVQTMMYWNMLKEGPAMSMNFRENYDTFKDYYWLRCVGSGILVLLALSLLISSFFLGKTKTIGTRQGTVWK